MKKYLFALPSAKPELTTTRREPTGHVDASHLQIAKETPKATGVSRWSNPGHPVAKLLRHVMLTPPLLAAAYSAARKKLFR